MANERSDTQLRDVRPGWSRIHKKTTKTIGEGGREKKNTKHETKIFSFVFLSFSSIVSHPLILFMCASA